MSATIGQASSKEKMENRKIKLTEESRKKMDEFDKQYGFRHADKDGNLLSLADWIEKTSDNEYRTVGRHERGWILISTVWLGISPAFGLDYNFETMVFVANMDSVYEKRYRTLADAEKGHKYAVDKYSGAIWLFLVSHFYDFIKTLRKIL